MEIGKAFCVVADPLSSPQIAFYEDRDFRGKSYDCKGDSADLQGFIRRCNSVKVDGGWWVLYERDNYSGYQYVVGPGEYSDYRRWMGFNDCVRSCRTIRNVSAATTTTKQEYRVSHFLDCVFYGGGVSGPRAVQAEAVRQAELRRSILGADGKHKVHPGKVGEAGSPVLQSAGGLLDLL